MSSLQCLNMKKSSGSMEKWKLKEVGITLLPVKL